MSAREPSGRPLGLHPSDLSYAVRHGVHALGRGPAWAVRRQWRVRGVKAPLKDRTIAELIGCGMAALPPRAAGEPDRAELTEAGLDMLARLRRGR